MHTCTHMHTHTCTHTHAHTHVHTYVHTHMCTHAHIHAHIHAYTCEITHVNTRTHTHTHTCTHVHTQTCTQTQMCIQPSDHFSVLTLRSHVAFPNTPTPQLPSSSHEPTTCPLWLHPVNLSPKPKNCSSSGVRKPIPIRLLQAITKIPAKRRNVSTENATHRSVAPAPTTVAWRENCLAWKSVKFTWMYRPDGPDALTSTLKESLPFDQLTTSWALYHSTMSPTRNK